MLLKNAAQKVHVYAYDSTTGAAKTGDAAQITGYVSLDGTANAIDDTNPAEVDATNLPGVYVFDITAAETNCDSWALYAKSSTANIRIEPIIGFTTVGTATGVALAADQAVNVTKIAGTTVDATAAQLGVNVVNWKGSAAPAMTGDAYARLGAPAGASVSADIAAIEAQTDDIGAAGAGLTAVPWNAAWDAEVQSEAQDAITASSLATAASLATVAGYLDTEVAAILAAVDTEVGAIKAKTDYLPSATAGAAGGVFIAGSNAATSVTTALTANITGNVSGSVGSVASGGITAASIATGAVDADALAADAGTEIAAAVTTALGTGSGLTTLATAANLAALAALLPSLALTAGTVQTSGGANTATSFYTNLAGGDDFWNDCLLLITSGALAGQVKKISDFADANGVVTLDAALTGTPADGVTFTIINR